MGPFDIHDLAKYCKYTSPNLYREIYIRRRLEVKLNVKLGQTIHRHLTVPRRENCRDVTIKWKEIEEPHFVLVSDWKDGARWVYSRAV